MRIAVSGTYSTGKTTTTEALARWVGVPRTHARTMREILPEAIPGKALEDCGPADLFQLGLLRFTERAVRESAMTGTYISDGSSLHEWIYGKARMKVGINPNDHRLVRLAKSLLTLPYRPLLVQINEAFGAVVKRHAKLNYDEFIHLPVEFPLVADGHRPVSEAFRALSDQLLKQTLDELGIKYHVVSGSIEQRLQKIAELYGLVPVMPLEQAVAEATQHVRAQHIAIESDAQTAALRRHTARGLGVLQRIRQRVAA
jgi:nicotinamide riboside kinase